MGSLISSTIILWKARDSLGPFPLVYFALTRYLIVHFVSSSVSPLGEVCFHHSSMCKINSVWMVPEVALGFFGVSSLCLARDRCCTSCLFSAACFNLLSVTLWCHKTTWHTMDCGGGCTTKSVMNSLLWFLLLWSTVQHVACFPQDLFSLVGLTCLISEFPLS